MRTRVSSPSRILAGAFTTHLRQTVSLGAGVAKCNVASTNAARPVAADPPVNDCLTSFLGAHAAGPDRLCRRALSCLGWGAAPPGKLHNAVCRALLDQSLRIAC